jgi:hypothetical protein
MGRIGCTTGLALAAAAALPGRAALAQEYCVVCSEPYGLYRCVIEGAQPRGGQSLQMLCVTTMAKQGGHATCSVKRGTVFECDAAVKRVPWAPVGAGQPQEGSAAREASPPAAPPPPPPPRSAPADAAPPAPAAPPQTVVDLAKQANEQAAEQVKKAGDSVKEATKKTWDCMLSLFTRCK